MGFLYLIAYLAQITPLVLYFALFKRNSKIIELRVLFFYVLASCLAIIFLGVFPNQGIIIISIFELVEFTFFSAFFFLFIQNRKFKNLIVVITIITLCIETFLFFSFKTNFDFWTTLTTAVLIVTYSIFFFFEQINSPRTLIIYQSYVFWIVVGCIIYISGTLFLFLYTSDLKDKQNNSLWNIDIVFEFIKNICFSIAFFVARNNQRNLATQNFDDTNMFEKPF